VRVVVTGSSGQLGSTVVAQLRAARVDVVGVDARSGPRTDVVADVRDGRAMRATLRRAGAVVHTASLHGPHVPARSKHDFIDVNVAGTQTLLDAARAAGVQRIAFSSTTSVYGHALEPDGDAAVWVDEALVPRPRDIYDVTKLAAERLCELFTAETGVPTACLRVSRFSFDTVPRARGAVLPAPGGERRRRRAGPRPRAAAAGARPRRPQRLGRLAVSPRGCARATARRRRRAAPPRPRAGRGDGAPRPCAAAAHRARLRDRSRH
jgi:NAD-dependent epimerase/dehydratase family protein